MTDPVHGVGAREVARMWLGHRGQHDDVGPAVAEQQRHAQGPQQVVAVDRAGRGRRIRAGTAMPEPRSVSVSSPERPGRHRPGRRPAAGCWSDVVGVTAEVQEAGRSAFERGRPEVVPLREVDRRDPVWPWSAVVADDEAAVRPATRTARPGATAQTAAGRGRMAVRVGARSRGPLTSRAPQSYAPPELVGQRAPYCGPAEVVLRQAVNDHDGRTVGPPSRTCSRSPAHRTSCIGASADRATAVIIVSLACRRRHRGPYDARTSSAMAYLDAPATYSAGGGYVPVDSNGSGQRANTAWSGDRGGS